MFLWTQRQGLGPIPLTPLQLTRNFRSDTAVVQWINHHCARLFPQTADITLGAVPFTSAESDQMLSSPAGVFCHGVHENEHKTQHDETIGEIISNAYQQPHHPSIAVLARAKKHLLGIIAVLKQKHIPFIAHEIDPFAVRPHVVDFLSLLTAMCDPNDRIAWYALLRSPLVGLSLADLLALHEQQTEGLLWDSMQAFSSCTALSAEGKTRLERVVPLLAYWHAQKRRHTLQQWIRSLWLVLGGPYAYPGKDVQTDLDKADAIIGLYHSMDPTSALPLIKDRLASAFTDAQNQCETTSTSTSTAIATATSNSYQKPPVVLMTIHKAKGLEFDVVIIPHAHLNPRRQDPELMLWIERKHESGVDIIICSQRSHQADTDKLYQLHRPTNSI